MRDPNVKAWLDDPKKGSRKLTSDMKQVAETALQAAQEKRFFHWELEFPEVFFGPAAGTTQVIELKQDGGFDAVVGNPPYVRVQRIAHQETDYLFQRYVVCRKKIDISLAFLELGNLLIAEHSYAGFISSSQWLATDYGASAREFMRQGRIARIIDFGSLPIFEEASTYPAIFIFAGKPVDTIDYLKVASTVGLSLSFLKSASFAKHSYKQLSLYFAP